MWGRKIWGLNLALLCGYLAAAPAVQAHKLLVATAPQADGGLKVQAFFPDGNPAQEVPITVIPGDGRPPLYGKADSQGVAHFPPLTPGDYRVVVGDPLGHRAETRVVVPGAGPEATPLPQAAPREATPPGPGGSSLPGEPIPWVSILAGLGFVFGVTALLMVLQLRREVRKHAPRD